MDIHTTTLSACWLTALAHAISEHHESTELRPSTGQKQVVLRIEPLTCSFREFDLESPAISLHVGAAALKEMRDIYINKSRHEGHSYVRYVDLDGYDQTKWVVDILRRFPKHRRAYVSFQTNSSYIEGTDQPPCINFINYVIEPTTEELCITAVFSAQNLYRKFVPDLVAVKDFSMPIVRSLFRPLGTFRALIVNPVISQSDVKAVTDLVEEYGV